MGVYFSFTGFWYIRLWIALLELFHITHNRCRLVLIHPRPVGQWHALYTPTTHRFNEVERWVYWLHFFRLSICPSVDRMVFALYLQQSLSDPFNICASYQATSEGVSRSYVCFKIEKCAILANSLNLLLWHSLLLTWRPRWLNSIGNHEAARGILGT